MEDSVKKIPFVKPVHIGNFKVWRSKKVDVEQINVSTLDDCWQIKIPETVEMFHLVTDLYGENTTERISQLEVIFSNMMYVSVVPNGYFQQGIQLLATVYSNPKLLTRRDKGHRKILKDVKALRKGFLEWVSMYKDSTILDEPTDEEWERDELADESVMILNDDGNREKE